MADAAPLPHSSNSQQELSLLKIYTVYRVIVSMALLGAFLFAPFSSVFLGSLKPEFFFYGIIFYLAFNLIGLFVILPKSTQLTTQQLFLNFMVDIAAIAWCMDASGGVTNGLQLLLVVTIAAGSIMLSRQLSILLAALASIAVLLDTTILVNQRLIPNTSFITASLVGAILFITALLIQYLADKIRGSQQLAEQRAIDVSKLQQLNQQIVERMRTGIIVCNQQGEILLANNAANELLGVNDLQPSTLLTHQPLPEVLLDHFNNWHQFPQYRTPFLHVDASARELQVSFTAISHESHADTLIFLEDNRKLAQRAQQMKLASLGRLTASIAHEIRNPLGAISHAAQLLNESEQLDAADLRLCEIIQNHSRRMNKVIENVLQLSSRNAPNAELINLKAWLEQFIDEFEFIGSADWHMELFCDDEGPSTLIDSSQFNQVITNLSQNGLRYSLQQTGQATLQFKLHIHPVTQLPILDIIDFGPGIDTADIDHIFEPFYTTDPKGSGLGLYISRELCEANEARLDYIRTADGHSCFRISFPHPDRKINPE